MVIHNDRINECIFVKPDYVVLLFVVADHTSIYKLDTSTRKDGSFS